MGPLDNEITRIINGRRFHRDVIGEIRWIKNAFTGRNIDTTLSHGIFSQPEPMTGELLVVGPAKVNKITLDYGGPQRAMIIVIEIRGYCP
jgi:hypothetical protein